MICKKCLREIPSNAPFCIYCGEEQDIEKDFQKITTVDKEEKNMCLAKFKEQAKIFINNIKKLPAKTKKIIVCVFFAVLILCLIISISSNKNKLIGKWENGQIGYIIFTENGQFFVDNDDISGEYKVDGSTITIYKENGNIEYWEFDISNDILTMTYNNETMALYKSK